MSCDARSGCDVFSPERDPDRREAGADLRSDVSFETWRLCGRWEYERIAKRNEWVVIRRDWSTRLCDEADFATAIAGYLREAVEALSVKAKIKNRVTVAMKAIGQIQVQLAEGVTVSVGPGGERPVSSVLEDRLRVALAHVGEIAQAQGRGVALLFDEAHSVYDRDAKRQFPLGALQTRAQFHPAKPRRGVLRATLPRRPAGRPRHLASRRVTRRRALHKGRPRHGYQPLDRCARTEPHTTYRRQPHLSRRPRRLRLHRADVRRCAFSFYEQQEECRGSVAGGGG